MVKKNLFKKKNEKWYKKIIIFFSIILLIFFLYYFEMNKVEYFVVPFNNQSFYHIPIDKGGKEIANQDKKGLHLSYKGNNLNNVINDKNINYSIQIFADSNYEYIANKRENLLKKKDSIFQSKDLYLAIFNSSLGNEYYLLYKNFETRISAKEYCEKYIYFLDNCLIVNAQKLD